MAGGMGNRGGYGPMADRVAQGRGERLPPPAAPPEVKHCWVSGPQGRHPALLLSWEKRESGWFGRVVRPVNEEVGWILVEEWLPAHLLEPATSTGV